MDLLTDILRVLDLRGTVYFRAEFRAPWGMDIAGGEFANFHLVVDGNCWLRLEGSLHELQPGDVVLLPHGTRHSLLHLPDGPAVPAPEFLEDVRYSATTPVYGGEGEGTTLICGHFSLDQAGSHPLFSGLPSLLRLSATEGASAQWVTTATELAAAESRTEKLGSTAVVDRIAELLLIQILRGSVESGALSETFMAALADPELRPSLELIHSSPAFPWTLETLCERVHMSRTKFTERFRKATGLAPIQYLTLWRMQRARQDLIASPEATISTVAERVGYSSEFAFSKAFKRIYGHAPAAARRTR